MPYRCLLNRIPLALLCTLALSACLGAHAGGASTNTAQAKPKDTTVRPRAFQHLSKAQDALGEERTGDAFTELERMRAREDGFSPYERALMWQLYAHIYASAEQYPDAISALKKSLALDALPDEMSLDARFNLGQLLMAAEQAREASDVLSAWLAQVPKPTPESRYLVAIALAQAERHREALPQIRASVAEHTQPPEGWLTLQASVELHLEEYAAAAITLEQLLARFAKKSYWLQLAGVYGQLERHADSVAVLEILYRQGELRTPDELLQLARGYLHQEVPLKAANLLRAHFEDGSLPGNPDTLELWANSLLHARKDDDAGKVLQLGSSRAEHGRLDLRYAQLLADGEQWTKAERSVQRALEKGGLKSEGEAYMLLGAIHYNQGSNGLARGAFEKAAGAPDSAHNAKLWLSRLSGEKPPSTHPRETPPKPGTDPSVQTVSVGNGLHPAPSHKH